jgi:hypothetical protein
MANVADFQQHLRANPIPAAIYLVGHGARREPRLVELQLVRIRRYTDCLEEKLQRRLRIVETFVDLNWPRVSSWDPDAFPSFGRLCSDLLQGRFDSVLIDLAPGDPRSWAPYDAAVPLLSRHKARVFNAFYDHIDALKDRVGAVYGAGAELFPYNGPDDASDLIAFFPTLASAVALEAIDERRRYSPALEAEIASIRHLGNESPYVAGREPFLEPRLERRMWDALRRHEEEARARRRKGGEALYRIDLESEPVLVDEGVSGGARRPDQLEWAETRLVDELGFSHRVEGVVVSYERLVDGFIVLADPRHSGRLAFRVYAVRDPGAARRRRTIPRYGTFSVPDSWKRDLRAKLDTLMQQAIASLRPRGATLTT